MILMTFLQLTNSNKSYKVYSNLNDSSFFFARKLRQVEGVVLGKRVTMHTCIVEGEIKEVWGFDTVSLLGVDSLSNDCSFIPADWGS